MLGEPRQLLKAMFDAAIGAASPKLRIPAYLPPPPKGRTVVIGAGKASAAMAKAVEDLWPGPLTGLVVTRYGHAVPCKQDRDRRSKTPSSRRKRPPSRQTHAGNGEGTGPGRPRSCADLRRWIVVADACLPMVSALEDKQAVNAALLRSGASIGEMNIVRKHLSAIKGRSACGRGLSRSARNSGDFGRARETIRPSSRPVRQSPTARPLLKRAR